jgi:hypothetical protein
MTADWIVNQRVRYYSENPEREPEGTVILADSSADHITVEWDDGHEPSHLDFLEADRKLERL